MATDTGQRQGLRRDAAKSLAATFFPEHDKLLENRENLDLLEAYSSWLLSQRLLPEGLQHRRLAHEFLGISWEKLQAESKDIEEAKKRLSEVMNAK